MNSKTLLFSVTFLGMHAGYASTLTSMNASEVKKELVNKTFVSIATDNLNGKTINNVFSTYLDKKGKIYGRMSVKPKNEPQTDVGQYEISRDGAVYITWENWDRHKKLCANFYDTKNAYLAISCDKVFHTVFMKESIREGNHL